jgi:hypothetical protein
MKYDVETGPGAMIYIPSFINASTYYVPIIMSC